MPVQMGGSVTRLVNFWKSLTTFFTKVAQIFRFLFSYFVIRHFWCKTCSGSFSDNYWEKFGYFLFQKPGLTVWQVGTNFATSLDDVTNDRGHSGQQRIYETFFVTKYFDEFKWASATHTIYSSSCRNWNYFAAVVSKKWLGNCVSKSS